MKRTAIYIVCAGIIFSLGIIGCQKSSPTGPASMNPVSSSDQQSIAAMISQDALLTNDVTIFDDGAASNSPSLAKTDTVISPRAWGRHFTSWTGDKVYTQLDDSTVLATITNTLTGNLWIWSTGGTVQKPITMTTTRNVKFVKVIGKDSTKWTEKFVSAMQGTTSSGVDTISITDVTFFIGSDTIDITSPPDQYYLQMGRTGRFGLHTLIRDVTRKFTVQATVVSNSPDSDVVVLYHPNASVVRIRERMVQLSVTPNGDGKTYTHVYKRSWIGDYPGDHTITVGALSKNSLFDSQDAVTSHEWGIPYIVQ
ncbi:MAG TPA: hypothetical protein VMU30_09185 [Bacteroidota bacterium]|nr:hypothetical protein [Bacteroidota bacterium]